MLDISFLKGRSPGVECAILLGVPFLKQKALLQICVTTITGLAFFLMLFSVPPQSFNLVVFVKAAISSGAIFLFSWILFVVLFGTLLQAFEDKCRSIPLEDREALATDLFNLTRSLGPNNMIPEKVVRQLTEHDSQSLLSPLVQKIEQLNGEVKKYGFKLVGFSRAEVGSAYIFIYGRGGLQSLLADVEHEANKIPARLQSKLENEKIKAASECAKARLDTAFGRQ